ncbi:MAG TPA: hypothetical protein VGH23_16515 [Rhizomicrobium sp.]|jgi:hypothetical protein
MKRTAAIILALLTVAAPAQAYIISKEVGPLLKEAQSLILAKNYKAAMDKVNEAEAVKVSADDATVINQFRQVIEVKTLVCRPGERYRVIGKMVEPCPKS